MSFFLFFKHTDPCKCVLSMTRQNDKSSQIKATRLWPVFSLSPSLCVSSPSPEWICCSLLQCLTQTGAFPCTISWYRYFFVISPKNVHEGNVYMKDILVEHSPSSPFLWLVATDGHCYHVQQMSQMIGKSLSLFLLGFISFSRLQLLLVDEGYLCVIPGFEPQSEPVLPPPTWSLPLSLSSLLHFKSSKRVSASLWLGGGGCLSPSLSVTL